MRRVSTWKENDWLVLVLTNDNDNEDDNKDDNKVNLWYEESPHAGASASPKWVGKLESLRIWLMIILDNQNGDLYGDLGDNHKDCGKPTMIS